MLERKSRFFPDKNLSEHGIAKYYLVSRPQKRWGRCAGAIGQEGSVAAAGNYSNESIGN
jgi:hypothetical protein